MRSLFTSPITSNFIPLITNKSNIELPSVIKPLNVLGLGWIWMVCGRGTWCRSCASRLCSCRGSTGPGPWNHRQGPKGVCWYQATLSAHSCFSQTGLPSLSTLDGHWLAQQNRLYIQVYFRKSLPYWSLWISFIYTVFGNGFFSHIWNIESHKAAGRIWAFSSSVPMLWWAFIDQHSMKRIN